MKSGFCLGIAALLAVVLTSWHPVSAQSLGLGTGSRMQSGGDTSGTEARERADDAGTTRKSQINKRLGLSARKGQAFDPKVFEARGRELQGQFYEIGSSSDPKQHGANQPMGKGGDVAQQGTGRRQWMIWVSVAGLAGASAGAVGYVLMSRAHPASAPPKELLITDDPP